MPVNLSLAPGQPVAGVELVTTACGIKRDGSTDLVLMRLAEGSTCAAVFTQSAFAAAPVTVAREHLDASVGAVRALLVNSGNANAGTGEPGIAMARGHCEAVGQALGVPKESVLPFSTGVIGQMLPDERLRGGIEEAASRLARDGAGKASEPRSGASGAGATGAIGEAPETDTRMASAIAGDSAPDWLGAARGIMTTDTVPKLTSRTITLGGGENGAERLVTVTGFAKGAGMIEPHMATMLAYVFTDAAITAGNLRTALRPAVDVSFNAISVDGDTSTNDACVLCATGRGASLSPDDGDAWHAFTGALSAVLVDLAQAIVRDAEGATKFVAVRVRGGRDAAECRAVAYSVANSPLVKTAMFASDANVGRLLMAIGKADVEALDPAGVTVSIGDVLAFERGGIAADYTEDKGAAVMAEKEISVTIDLGRGEAAVEIWTSDLSHDYVSVNADYRS